ncbi:MBOAT family protein [Aestuariibacter sp. AA17]|uniref:Probable alginate O-acetylase n=1 Tax=Fluctibacter corallii TaxID=2984329 RepID=A0ABT3A898_9ALTE|nr:MBOAT family protein [Aestuariibacter sp. AA17]MCV2884907.1 MBOAT family protein [Aestuariibacter sp. AA17]
MVFSSSIFLFAFLPVFLAIYYATPFRYRSFVILIGSYAFYAWWRIDFLLLFVLVTLWNYVIGIQMHKHLDSNPSIAKRWLAIGVTGDLLTLGYFKYANFGIESLNAMLATINSEPLPLANVILPIGISFYIFQAISYLVDVHRKDTPPTKRFIDFAAFIALFPQLIAGPVLRYKDLAHQFEHREHSFALFSAGVVLFMKGFIKKVLIADTVAPLADAAFTAGSLTTIEAWTGALAYSIQLYFDFSGYSDMAIGLGLMMGFRFIQNFNQPYISQSITEFWRRWHISLSSWLRDYLYISLGGNRHGVFKTYRNLFLTMLLGGLWHGANWTFVLWGAWHGGWLAIERALGLGHYKTFNLLAWMFTMLLVVIGWVMFRADSVQQAFTLYEAMFIPNFASQNGASMIEPKGWQLTILAIGIITVLLRGAMQHAHKLEQFTHSNMMANTVSVLRLPVFLIALSSLIASSYSPFLYFQF